MKQILPCLTSALLAAILVLLILILKKLPGTSPPAPFVTAKEWEAADGKQEDVLRARIPAVYITEIADTVEIQGDVKVR